MLNEKMLAENLRNKFKPQFEALENYSALAQHRSITESDVLALGRQLEQVQMWENYLKESAANGVNGGFASDLGTLPKKALDIITAAYGTSVIPELCSVQPIEEEQGIIWFKEVVAKTTRGNVEAGAKLFQAQEMPTAYPQGFASASMQEEVAVLKKSAASASKALSAKKIRKHSVKIMLQKGSVGSEGFVPESTLSFFAHDDGNGTLLGNQMAGTVNYDTGDVVVNFYGDLKAEIIDKAADDTIRVVAILEQDFERAGNEQIGAIQYELSSKFVQARVFALTESLGLLKSFSMQKRFGKSAEDEMINDLINTLTLEVGGAVLTDLLTGCRAYKPQNAGENYTNSVVYNMKSYQAPILAVQTLGIKLNEASQKIYTQSGRGEGNIICAGPSACTQIACLEGFKPSGISIQGPHVFGTIGNVTVIRVPSRVPGFELDTCMVVYKGTGDFDAPAVYSPYMPLYVSGSVPILNNPLMKQGVVCTWAGISTTAPQFLTEIKFSNSYEPEEQFPVWNTPAPAKA